MIKPTVSAKAIQNFLETSPWPRTAFEISEKTGYPLSTVYVALKSIRAERVKTGKNQFGYVARDTSDTETFESVRVTLGTIDARAWKDVAESTIRALRAVEVTGAIDAADYAEGFEAAGKRFLELAAHAREVQDRPDWKIVLGFDIDTEQE